MKPSFSDSTSSLTELVSFLATQQENILKNWRIRCDQDPSLHNVAGLARKEFNNSIPKALTILQQRLAGQPDQESLAQLALDHGLQRRHKAHLISETVRELNHLTQALYNELPHFQALFPQTDPSLFWAVQQHMTQIMSEIIDGSIQVYDELQRVEATTRAAILQKALDQLNAQLQEQNDRLRSSMHDLRGGFDIISGAADLLQLEGLSEPERTDYLAMLSRNLTSVQAMLANLMDLSRLEAGQESRQIQPLDAAPLLRAITSSVQPLAHQKGLVVQTDGPETLPVETDGVKLQRIVQNLLLNALKYTATGFVKISWAQQQGDHWLLSIQDSGPGLPRHIVSHFQGVVTAGTEPEGHQLAPSDKRVRAQRVVSSALSQPIVEPRSGEGIGLTIVSEFSQLLKARLEIETAQGQGTSFRFVFPIRFSYESPTESII
ncbi:sensor histidine kinase [Spirosoma koreense]